MQDGFEKTEWLGKKVRAFESLDSTNTTAKQLAAEEDCHGMLVLATEQKAGKGSKGRTWESSGGSGIFMSVILKPELSPANASMLTLVMALAVAGAVRQLTKAKAYIKWPNDILVNDKKICGILTEMHTQSRQISWVVIGVGVNVNTRLFSEPIKDKATSLYLETGREYSKEEIMEQILLEFEAYYHIFSQTQNFSALIQDYHAYLIQMGRATRIQIGNEVITGTTIGINERGELLIQKADGTIWPVCSGEVTVRGKDGYI